MVAASTQPTTDMRGRFQRNCVTKIVRLIPITRFSQGAAWCCSTPTIAIGSFMKCGNTYVDSHFTNIGFDKDPLCVLMSRPPREFLTSGQGRLGPWQNVIERVFCIHGWDYPREHSAVCSHRGKNTRDRRSLNSESAPPAKGNTSMLPGSSPA